MKKIEAINNVIFDVLEINNYSPKEKGEAIVIDRENKKYPIIIKKEEVSFEDLNQLIQKFGKKFLVISIKGFTPGAIELAKEEEINLWTKTKLEKEIGKSVLSEVGFEENIEFNWKINKTTSPDLKNKNKTTSSNPELMKTKKSNKEEKRNKKPKDDIKVFNLNLEKKGAIKKAGISSPDFISLKLIPYYQINYRCKTEFNDEKVDLEINENGEIFVNATNGEIKEFFNKKISKSFEPKEKVDKETKKIKKEDAEKEAKKYLKQKHSVKENFGENKNETIIYEEKTLEPDFNDIDLDQEKIIYRPLWIIRDSNSTIKIDAVNGDVLSGNTQKGVEFL